MIADPERPGDHNRRQQDAEFAQDQNADKIDDENGRAETSQLENALLRHNGADQKIDQDDDRDAAKRDGFQMENQRRAAEI